ncbi:unnamed protein product [Allacma fusca]|uniref:Aquaporin n=1 Tax=Allacma fusca TaxID=39272 RepID=A0A8J2K9V3_9HEXA|nr:unnamed protein product [Allacma fusca]
MDKFNKTIPLTSGIPAVNIIEEYNDLFVSLILIVVVSLVAQLLRVLISKVFASKSWLRILLHEIIATAEMCVTCFELGIVAENYGIEYYAAFYFASSLWWALTWKEAYAFPNGHLEDYLKNETDGGTAAVVTTVEILTACFVFKLLVKPLWALKYIPIHEEKLVSLCSADLTVRPLFGGLIEGSGTFIFSVVSKIVVNRLESELLATVLNSVMDTILVVLAYDYSGGYFNPVLATSMQYGCEGTTTMDHLVVYWVGGLLDHEYSNWLVYGKRKPNNVVCTKTVGKADFGDIYSEITNNIIAATL